MAALFSGLWAAITRYSLGDIATVLIGGALMTAAGVGVYKVTDAFERAGAAPEQVANAKLKCDNQKIAADNAAMEELVAANRRAAEAAQKERDRQKTVADQRLFKIHDLEVQLAVKPAAPECGYSPEVTGSLRK
jgi:hypothetical protein